MKNPEQMLKAFLKKKDLLDLDGTKSGGVPHIQLSESIPTETAPVWVRDHYDKSSKTYACHKYDDSNHEKFLKGKRKIYIDFTF